MNSISLCLFYWHNKTRVMQLIAVAVSWNLGPAHAHQYLSTINSERMAVNDVVLPVCSHRIPWQGDYEVILLPQKTSFIDFMVSMEIPARVPAVCKCWVKYFKDGNWDITNVPHSNQELLPGNAISRELMHSPQRTEVQWLGKLQHSLTLNIMACIRW
jgi:hypothetical protein